MMSQVSRYLAIVTLVACSKGGSESAPPSPAVAPPTASNVAPTAPPAAATPQVKDDGAKQLLATGTACAIRDGRLPLDCAELKATSDYAFQHQGSAAVAETCAAFLRDPDTKKRLLAATCLEHLNAVGVTPQLGAALDALEIEKDDGVREALAWGIKDAEAVTAKLDDRVLALVTRFAADPKTDKVAGYLFSTLFPQYMMGSGPTPPVKAQALAIEALGHDDTGMQRAAFNAISLIADKPAVCKALEAQLVPTAKHWAEAAEGIAQMKDACVEDVQRTLDLLLARLAAGDARLDLLRRFDRVFDLEPAVRAKIATALRSARPKAQEWQRKQFDEAIALFSKPPVKKH